MNKSKYVITITRQFCSMGQPIAKRLAEMLDIEYYDRDLVDHAAEKLNLPVSKISEEEEKAVKEIEHSFLYMAFPMGRGSDSTKDQIFEAQKNIIQFLAEKENCIIVGRCSDFILSEMENAVHIYIYASYDARLARCMEEFQTSEEEARKMITTVDEAREAYHVKYAGYKPDDKRSKDIMINSSLLGIEGTSGLLANVIRQKFDIKG